MNWKQWFVFAGIFLVGVVMFQVMANTALEGESMMREIRMDIINNTGELPKMNAGDIIFSLRYSLYQSFTFLCLMGLMGCLICGCLEMKK